VRTTCVRNPESEATSAEPLHSSSQPIVVKRWVPRSSEDNLGVCNSAVL